MGGWVRDLTLPDEGPGRPQRKRARPSKLGPDEQLLWTIGQKAVRLGLLKAIPKKLDRYRTKSWSKKGRLGRIYVRREGRVVPNKASNFVSKFSTGLGGREEVMAALVAIEEKLSPTNKRVLDGLRQNPSWGLAHAIAEAKAEPVNVVKQVIDGQLVLGKAEALGELAVNQGALMRDLLRHALDRKDVCPICSGRGQVAVKDVLHPEEEKNDPCPGCLGSGHVVTSSKHKEWAMKKALEIAELGDAQKGVSVNVNTAIGVRVEGAASERLAQLARVSDEILFQSRTVKELPQEATKGSDILEAEVISNGQVPEPARKG